LKDLHLFESQPRLLFKELQGQKNSPLQLPPTCISVSKIRDFCGRENCKSLLEKELKIYGIFEDSKIVPLYLCLFRFRASEIEQRQKGSSIFDWGLKEK
jgi:hypothetical protein